MKRLYEALSLAAFVMLFMAVLAMYMDEAARQEYPSAAVAYGTVRP